MKPYRVLFHVDESAAHRCQLVLNNIKNLLADIGADQVEAELLANGEGVFMLLKRPGQYADQIAQLAEKGVRFAACAHSLRGAGIERLELMDAVEVVPAGVGELVRKQAEGWLYIRP